MTDPAPIADPHARSTPALSRRRMLGGAAAAALTIALPQATRAAMRRLDKPITLGLIADLHHDIMHDGAARLEAFVDDMKRRRPDAIMQLGDFAYPDPKNQALIDQFNKAHQTALHVIGNHDMDAQHTRPQCVERWGMPDRYYTHQLGNLTILVLDGNDSGSPTHKSGYPAYVGPEQVDWLKRQLATLEGPILVASHQPLAGPSPVDNAAEIQAILADAADRILLAINGHTHIDDVIRIGGVNYLHVNSASYYWLGGAYRHESYSSQIHAAHPWIACTCPYRDSLFAALTIDPQTMSLRLQGRRSQWVGPSPADLHLDRPGIRLEQQVVPMIRDRRFDRPAT